MLTNNHLVIVKALSYMGNPHNKKHLHTLFPACLKYEQCSVELQAFISSVINSISSPSRYRWNCSTSSLILQSSIYSSVRNSISMDHTGHSVRNKHPKSKNETRSDAGTAYCSNATSWQHNDTQHSRKHWSRNKKYQSLWSETNEKNFKCWLWRLLQRLGIIQGNHCLKASNWFHGKHPGILHVML